MKMQKNDHNDEEKELAAINGQSINQSIRYNPK